MSFPSAPVPPSQTQPEAAEYKVETRTSGEPRRPHKVRAEPSNFQLAPPCLGALDSALHRLGMLATATDMRREFLREKHQDPLLNMVRINTRYVSNVSIGFRVRPLTPHVRYKPYTIRERHRTRSENNEEKDGGPAKAVVDEVVESSVDLAQLKKAKSLESIVAECASNAEIDLQNINFPELEVVSNSIQNLKVAE